MYVPRFTAIAIALLIAAGASHADLMSSVRSGDAEAVSALLGAGTDPNSAEPDGPPALYHAAHEGHSDVFHLLIDAGADVERASCEHWSLLSAAVYGGDTDVVAWLLERGVRADQPGGLWHSTLGGTPLNIAAHVGHTDIARLLIDRSADVNAEADSHSHRRPLHTAAGYGHAPVARMLLEAGAEVDALDRDDATPLYRAARNGHPDVARALLEADADPNVVTRHGYTPLHKVAASGSLPLIALLIEHGADPNAAGGLGHAPLESALAAGNTAAADALLEAGARLSLGAAVMLGDTDRVRQFLADGADPMACTRSSETALHWAIGHAHIEIARMLVEAGADVDATSERSRDEYFMAGTPLSLAAQAGYADLVDLLLAEGADVHAPDDLDRPLFEAARAGHAAIVTTLLAHEADPTVTIWTGATPLHYATIGGHADVARLLLDAGADINAVAIYPPKEGPTRHCPATPVHWAAEMGHAELAALFIERGADVTLETGAGITAAGVAVAESHDAIAQALLDAGTEPTLNDAILLGDEHRALGLVTAEAVVEPRPYSPTALHLAAQAGMTELAQALLAAGADPEAPGGASYGLSVRGLPLAIAAEGGHTQIVAALLAAGAEADAADRNDRTALHAACKGGHLDVARLLIKHGADVRATFGHYDATALEAAVSSGNVELARYLVAQGARVDRPATYGRRPLSLASVRGDLAMMRALLELGADPNARSEDGFALARAAWAGEVEAARLLLDAGADVNARDGAAALHSAAGSGHTKMVALLLDAGANVNARISDADPRTPLEIALERGHEDTAALLREHGGVE